jgi:hypothetical protein
VVRRQRGPFVFPGFSHENLKTIMGFPMKTSIYDIENPLVMTFTVCYG